MKTTQTHEQVAAINAQTLSDFRNAVLLTSLLANLYILTAWLVVSVA